MTGLEPMTPIVISNSRPLFKQFIYFYPKFRTLEIFSLLLFFRGVLLHPISE